MAEPAPRTGVRVPVGVDTTRPSIARVYDYSLGGKDNYDVDRAAFEQIQRIAPRQGDVSRMNRRWLHRVVRYLAGPAAIDQFLDIGAGLPTVGNTHQIAQQENPEATVVYVDNDPVCNAHGRVLLEQNENTHFVSGDLLEENTLLENKNVLQYLDMDRPIAVILCGLLHHVDDELEPARVMREYIARLPAGSYVAITNFWDPDDENPELHDLAVRLERAFTEMGLGSGWYRTRAEQLEYFDGLEIIAPGLVELEDWWPAGPATRPRLPEEKVIIGGVGYKRPVEKVRLRSVNGTG
ncbi:SAM-dependent methyltransferase [Nocardia grenadensis]|uniref:SAM-dependent methyltransferase n=1 Tax=Nocardia grenadensis TaxID=931537 RepID=UPI0007A54100|nr:SAM-dependent methyltransferase [Nocardia grenadensis]